MKKKLNSQSGDEKERERVAWATTTFHLISQSIRKLVGFLFHDRKLIFMTYNNLRESLRELLESRQVCERARRERNENKNWRETWEVFQDNRLRLKVIKASFGNGNLVKWIVGKVCKLRHESLDGEEM